MAEVHIHDPLLQAFAELARREFSKFPEEKPYELLHLEWATTGGQKILRLYIDRRDGIAVGIEDCAFVNDALALALEVEDPIPHAYTFEVSSPGVNRPLVREEDFRRHLGKMVEVESLHPIEGRKRFKGILEGLNAEEVALKVNRELFHIPFTEIKKARLDYFASVGKE